MVCEDTNGTDFFAIEAAFVSDRANNFSCLNTLIVAHGDPKNRHSSCRCEMLLVFSRCPILGRCFRLSWLNRCDGRKSFRW